MRTSTFLNPVIFLLACVSSPAHDLWIEPSTFSPEPGQRFSVRLCVGQRFAGDPLPRSADLLREFILVGPDETAAVRGNEGSDPAGYAQAASPGLRVLGYHSYPFQLEVEPEKFEAYLVEEGLESAAFIRQREGTTRAPGREQFSRCAKALIRVGSGEDRVSARALGFRIELLPQIETFPLNVGENLTVRLLFEDEPLGGALVSAYSKSNPEEKRSERSDREGRATFTLDRAGVWLVKAVHMIPRDGRVDWESFWASLTFEVAEK